jgi:glycerophosphoryl diester phosphodiesterase
MTPTTLTTTPPGSAGRRPLVIAHRGASFEAPENTIAAFELAAALGADGIAIDVRVSLDSQPVVLRDANLDRTTSGTGPVERRTVAELKRLDAGGWRGERFRGQRVQTLQEVLERFRDRLEFWIELTAGSDRYPEIEDRVVALLGIYGVLDRAVVQSLDHAALARIRASDPDVRVAGLVNRGILDPVAAAAAGWYAVGAEVKLVTRASIEAVRRAGLPWYVWTVNEPAQMDRLVALEPNGILTDRPDLLRERVAHARPVGEG